MTVTFTLTGGSASTDAGPFNISGTTSGGSLNGVSIATGITKQQLLTGHTVTNINDTITGGTIASTGTCTTTDTWSVTPTPTPTSTPIPPTPTAGVFYEYQLAADSYTQSTQACSNAGGEPAPPYNTVYAATNSADNVTQFFTDTNLITGYNGGSNQFRVYYRSSGGTPSGLLYVGRVSSEGYVTDRSSCSQ